MLAGSCVYENEPDWSLRLCATSTSAPVKEKKKPPKSDLSFRRAI